jgi:toxin HigB-1
VIKSFKCRDTEKLFNDFSVRRFQAFSRVARRKLKMLDDAAVIGDLAVLSGNRLEALKGNRKGQRSIRINDQYRICFIWGDNGVTNVEIVDYH